LPYFKNTIKPELDEIVTWKWNIYQVCLNFTKEKEHDLYKIVIDYTMPF
jgi:hypothetical protein